MIPYHYYKDRLAAERLKQAYELAQPRVRQYLKAEIEHAAHGIRPGDTVLELGCGYGRVLERLAAGAGMVVGIDTSLASLLLGKGLALPHGGPVWICTDAVRLGLRDHTFDCVVCIQNGISAFHTDRAALVAESMRVTKRGGMVLFSTYSEKFWAERLKWFQRQAEAGLLGEIDYDKTGNGNIVCKDGFTASTVSPDEFGRLTKHLDADVHIVEVDNSSLFCEIVVR